MELKFEPLCSVVEPGFWAELSRRKLEEWGLETGPRLVRPSFQTSAAPHTPCRLSFGAEALVTAQATPNSFALPGRLLLCNTAEDFARLDRLALMAEAGDGLREAVLSGAWAADPELLSPVLFTAFADLKKYVYYFWAAHPAFPLPTALKLLASSSLAHSDFLDAETRTRLPSLLRASETGKHHAFLLKRDGSLLPLSELLKESFSAESTALVVQDPSASPDVPGWPVRNLLVATASTVDSSAGPLTVICLRQRVESGVVTADGSLVLRVQWGEKLGPEALAGQPSGWERAAEGTKLGPRRVDMSGSLDPVRLAEEAVKLNLSLMRWRLLPELRVERMSNLKCLLFGAGTLGSNVARGLLGWGVSHLTFVDSGRVSYSNPPRQSLFQHEDCLDGGRPKAQAAADAVKRILPSATAIGHDLRVPMPGHPLDPAREGETKTACEKITALVEAHDVVFLLLDSREARWLPALLAAAHSKFCMTMALGFDSFLALRHGLGCPEEGPAGSPSTGGGVWSGRQLGCYFCADVTAPGNSQAERTLDQQCTVSRPGLSMACAGAGVEMLAAAAQHAAFPDVPCAAPSLGAEAEAGEGGAESCLGAVPHQIRAYLSRFQQLTPAVRRFEHCVACSPAIVGALRTEGWPFLRRAFNDPASLEDRAGLSQLHRDALDADQQILELSDEDSEQS